MFTLHRGIPPKARQIVYTGLNKHHVVVTDGASYFIEAEGFQIKISDLEEIRKTKSDSWFYNLPDDSPLRACVWGFVLIHTK